MMRFSLPRSPRRWWIASLFTLILGAMGYQYFWEVDHAIANVALAVGVVLALLLAWLGMLRALSGFRRTWVALTPFLLGAISMVLLKFDGFSGEIVPQFQWRFAPTKQLSKSVGGAGAGQPDAQADGRRVSGGGRFPQYLGTGRDGKVSSERFTRPIGPSDLVLRWKVSVGAGWSGMAIDQGRLYTLEQHDSSESVRCYRTQDGELLWKRDYEARHEHLLGGLGPRSTPSIVGDRLIVAGACGNVHCLDAEKGDILWAIDLNELAGTTQETFEATVNWGRSASPLCHDGMVYLPLGGDATKECQSLIAIDLESGQERWRTGEGQISYASPSLLWLDGIPQVLWLDQDFVWSCDPATGKVLWKHPWPSRSNGDACASQPMQWSNRRVLLTKGYGQGCRVLEVRQQAVVWEATEVWSRTPLLRTKFTSALIDGKHAYGLNDGILECVALGAGKRLWRQGRYGHGQVLLVEKNLVIASESGELVIVTADPEKPEVIARLPVLQGTTWNPPAVVGSQIYLRNAQEMARVDLLTDRDSL